MKNEHRQTEEDESVLGLGFLKLEIISQLFLQNNAWKILCANDFANQLQH